MRIDPADSETVDFRDQYIALRIERDAARLMEQGRGRGTAVARETGNSRSGNRADGAVCSDLPDPVCLCVGDINISKGIHGNAFGLTEQGLQRGTAVTDLAVGAHPGFQDLIGFGRRNMDLTPNEVYDLVVYQVGALIGFANAAGATLQHVKAHGALYNMAAAARDLAAAIARAVRDVDRGLVLFGLPNSHLISEAEAAAEFRKIQAQTARDDVRRKREGQRERDDGGRERDW